MAEQKRLPFNNLWNRLLRFGEASLNFIFYPAQSKVALVFLIAFLLLMFVWGVRRWGVFYSWGNISFDFLDWAEVTGPRYALLRDAAEKGVLPLHAGNLTALRGVTDRYFSIADTPFSPQYLLLPFMETGQYLFFDTLLLFTIGFIGLLIFFRKYRLSLFTFSLLFLLFNFNGNVISHLAVGHSIWTAHFLLPFFVLLVLHLVERENAGWKWVLGMVLLLLAILLQGYFHLWFWCLMFLAMLPLMNWRLWKPVFFAGLFSGLVGLPRLLPPSLALSGITQEYLGGFASATDLIDGLIALRDPYRALQPITDTFRLNYWEVDFYIGLMGFLLLLVFGVVVPLLRNRARNSVQVQLLVPSAVLVFFSIGDVFARVISILRVPPFTGERVPARMLELPLMVILFLAILFLQRELDRRKLAPLTQILALVLAYLTFHDLNQHMEAWRIRYLDSMVALFPKVPFDPAQHTLLNHADPIYTNMLLGGLAVSLLALGFLVFFAFVRRERTLRSGAPVKDALRE